jgi:hypothetical protein
MRAEARLSHDDACVFSTSEDGRVIAWDIVQAVTVQQYKVSDWCSAVIPTFVSGLPRGVALRYQHKRKLLQHDFGFIYR